MTEVMAQPHSILKHSTSQPIDSSDKIQRSISFKAVNVAITEKYRNFMNNERQKDIENYNRVTNPYYLAPSFNKPFLNYDFKTLHFQKKFNSNVILVFLKLNIKKHKQDNNYIDELSQQMLIYTIKYLAKNYDEIIVCSIINQYEIEYKDHGYYISSSNIEKYQSILDDEVVPKLKTEVLSKIFDDNNNNKQFKISLNLIFDPNIVYSIENIIIEFNPNIIIIANHENVDENKSRFLQNIIKGTSITKYCIEKLSYPIIIFTSECLKHYRLKEDNNTSIDERLDDNTITSNNVESINQDYFVNLLKSVKQETTSSRSSSRMRNKSPSRSLSPIRSLDTKLSPFISNDNHLNSNNFANLTAFKSADNYSSSNIDEDIKKKLKRSFPTFSRFKSRFA